MSQSIAVLGAGGFIGQHLIRALGRSGERPMALIRPDQTPNADAAESLSGFFIDPQEFEPVLAKARVIVHAASSSTPGATQGAPLSELELNMKPTLALLQALQKAPHCRLLYLSSGGTLYGDAASEAVKESQSLLPKSYYGAGKAAAEHFIHAASVQFGLRATILRPSNLYGPGQMVKKGFGIIPAVFQCARNNTPLTVWGDGTAVRDYLYIDDFIDLCQTVIQTPMDTPVQAFNASSGAGVDLKTLIALICTSIGAQVPVRFEATRTIDVSRIVLDPTKAMRTYDWRATTSLSDGIRSSWEWWRTQA
ncbi:NAD-dependent epimerase/dehydratase family protein [Shewanella chilikensis]|uniref:NAD-dependent epimerase/dehydratase family protein n=1 Tax=Shewanella chilikensis TaxID=558541 RepID=UPI003A974610